MTHFAFLQAEFPAVFEAARQAEAHVHGDPRAACFHARRALELALDWAYRHDPALRMPYRNDLAAMLAEPSFQQAAGPAIGSKTRLIKDLGNRAVHDARSVAPAEAVSAVRELFHVSYWLARTYGQRERPAPDMAFDAQRLPPADAAVRAQSMEQLARLQADLQAHLQAHNAQLRAQAEAHALDREALAAELAAARAAVAAAKAANQLQPDAHDYDEATTRRDLIDVLLHEAGWPLDQPQDREFAVTGMPGRTGSAGSTASTGGGFVDYVLWGEDGKPLALVEAKRTTRDAQAGQQQARLYADCLQARYGQRPVIFLSNGYAHWLWDDTAYPPRPVQGFYTRAELALLVQRRSTRQSLAAAAIDHAIVARPYQTRAIRRICETFEQDHQRRALVVMATGAGKTRTVIALVDLLMRCGWAKRVLFLADRVALVNQAVRAFKTFLPAAAPVNLVTDRHADGRVFVSTYPTMMGLVDDMHAGQRRFGPGSFDLVVIDEAHRSVYQKYGALFDWFDALLVGLTATPRDEIARDTYRLFNLERGVPTDAYALQDAVNDGYLVPAKAVSVPLRFVREGIRYADLNADEQAQWDLLEWSDSGDEPPPAEVNAETVNRWLFNTDTVDKVLQHLMTHGAKVAGGDRLGKTIVFAKNQAHAEFIARRFDAHYPQHHGHFARVVTFKTDYAQTLIDEFSKRDGAPHIAISVDMLDTGIDVPEVVNLVFFKLVRSPTKFWQMVGRGTRLCEDLFGPGQHKSEFLIFDFCQNLEYFGQPLPAGDGASSLSLGARLFNRRLDLLLALDARERGQAMPGRPAPSAAVPLAAPLVAREPTAAYNGLGALDEASVRRATAERLQQQVAAMNTDNFIVRPRRRLVEAWRAPAPWATLSQEQADALRAADDGLAGLPHALPAEEEEAQRFDLLLLRLQLGLLNAEPGFEPLRRQLLAIAGLLAEQAAIPMVRAQLVLIESLQTDDWWQDVTVPMLEGVRLRLRRLVTLIERRARRIVYTDFEDQLGPGSVHPLQGATQTGTDFERFRAKARAFLLAHEDRMALHKLRRNLPLTATDLADLELLLQQAGGSADALVQAREQGSLPLFVRSLVGLDRAAAKALFADMLAGSNATANQIEFVDMVIDHLTEQGVMEASRLYESPFTDLSPSGPEGLFSPLQIESLVGRLAEVRARAA